MASKSDHTSIALLVDEGVAYNRLALLYYLALLCEEGFPGLDRPPGQPTRSLYSEKLWLNHKFCLFKVLS